MEREAVAVGGQGGWGVAGGRFSIFDAVKSRVWLSSKAKGAGHAKWLRSLGQLRGGRWFDIHRCAFTHQGRGEPPIQVRDVPVGKLLFFHSPRSYGMILQPISCNLDKYPKKLTIIHHGDERSLVQCCTSAHAAHSAVSQITVREWDCMGLHLARVGPIHRV